MSGSWRHLPGLLAIGLVSLAAGVAPADAVDPTVIVLSWDGVRFDGIDRAGPLPALRRIERQGARATALVPAFPSITFPSHIALATCAPADRHGIVANRFLDPERGLFDYAADAGWIEAEPLWVAAEAQGVRTATYFWVGSETPWHGVAPSLRVAPFDASVPESAKVDRILAWLDLPPDERPRLVMSWWHGSDHAGHRAGPRSRAVAEALREQDAQLARLLAGLDARDAWPHTTLFVVSDHGMIAGGRWIDLRGILREAGLAVRVIHAGPVAHVHLVGEESAERVLARIASIDGVHGYRLRELPRRYRYAHPTRVGQVVVLADPPIVFSGAGRLERLGRRVATWLGQEQGVHGYDARDVPGMKGIFLALGRGIAAGARPGDVDALDVAPTVASLLGIRPPRGCEGRALELAGPGVRRGSDAAAQRRTASAGRRAARAR